MPAQLCPDRNRTTPFALKELRRSSALEAINAMRVEALRPVQAEKIHGRVTAWTRGSGKPNRHIHQVAVVENTERFIKRKSFIKQKHLLPTRLEPQLWNPSPAKGNTGPRANLLVLGTEGLPDCVDVVVTYPTVPLFSP